MNNSAPENSAGIQAAILTGGSSSRMGRDKALIEFDGQPLIERIFHRLGCISGIEDVFAVGDRLEYHNRDIEVVPDAFPGTGPLGGIASALDYANSRFVLVVATDMPFLSVDLIRAMIAIERRYDVLVPVRARGRGGQRGRQSYETLHAIYKRDVRHDIERKLSIGDNRIIGFFDEVKVQTLDESWVSEFDPEFNSFINVNRPEELLKIRHLKHGQEE